MNEDKKLNIYHSLYKKIIMVATIVFPLFFIYTLGFNPITPPSLRAIFLLGSSAFVIYFFPLNKKNNILLIIDFILILLSTISFSYIVFEGNELLLRIGTIPNQWDLIFGIIIVLIILEITRRNIGVTLPLLGLIFISYAFLGKYIPGAFGHRGYSFRRITGYLMGMDGILGLPTGVAATYVILFITFAAFLHGFGGGKFFIDLSTGLFGGTRGGPAKIAVIASSFFGTISGSPVANTVGTGSFTIPLMKQTGYEPSFAAAVEAVASTGGQIMPPIMGAGAFVIADIVGLPYLKVAAAALVPALLFYCAVFTMVDLKAVNMGLKGVPKNKLPNLKKIILKEGYLLLPLLVLLYFFIVLKTSPIRAALYAIFSMVFVGFVDKVIITRKLKEFIKMILNALHQSSKNVLMAATACACAGIVVGIINLTGVGIKMASLIVNLSGDLILPGLIGGMIVAIILGMGLPTTPAYIVAAAIVAPALIRMGLDPLPSHLFTFYFACLSNITPPVAVAAYAAAGIAEVPPMGVAFKAIKLGIVAFIIPYMFIYWPSLLIGMASFEKVVYSSGTALLGVIALSCSVQGRFWGDFTKIIPRVLLAISSIIMIVPGILTDVIGALAIVIMLIIQILKSKYKPEK